MARFLAVSYGAGHAQIIAMVTHELVRRGHEVHILALTTAAGVFNRAGLPCFGFRDLICDDDVDARRWGRELVAGQPAHPDVPAGESEAYLGLSYAELVGALGEAGAAKSYAEQGRQCFLPLKAVGRAFDRVQPDAVLTTNSPRAEAAAVMVARKRGIPCTVVVDFLLGFDLDRLKSDGYGDRLCVLTGAVRERLVHLGRRPDEVIVTGNPTFDALADQHIAERAQGIRTQRGWENRKTALLISQPEPNRPTFGLDIAHEISQTFPNDWRLVVRPHPNDRFTDADLSPGIDWNPLSDDLAASLMAVDAVIVIASTVGVQAALLGKPLCVLDVPAASEPVPFVEMGLGLPAVGTSEVSTVLKRIFAGERSDPRGLPSTGQATVRVADVAESSVRV